MIDTVLVLLRWVLRWLVLVHSGSTPAARVIGAWRERLLAGEVIAHTKTANKQHHAKVPSTEINFTNSTSFYDLHNDRIDMIEAQGQHVAVD